MSLQHQDVIKIARLARLSIDPLVLAEYAQNLANILELVEQMNTIDTKMIEPLFHPMNLPQRLRPDQVLETDQRDRFQQGAPAVENGLYLVPKVVE